MGRFIPAIRSTALFLGALMFGTMLLASCNDEDNGDDVTGPGSQPENGDVNGDDDEDTTGGDWWELVETDNVQPEDSMENRRAEYVDNRTDFEKKWNEYQFDGDPPLIDWNTQIGFFVATGESGSCPYELNEVAWDADERVLTIEADTNLPPDTACTMDWVPRTWIITADADHTGEGEIYIDLITGDDAAREDREPIQVR